MSDTKMSGARAREILLAMIGITEPDKSDGQHYYHDSEGVRWHRGKCPPLLRSARTKRKR